jgi:non-canonical poly(A) RNA polymerase PAPD5/7
VERQGALPKDGAECLVSRTHCTSRHAISANTIPRLHEEIVDFYNHVKPRRFEHKIRGQLLSNLQKIIKRDNMFRDASVQSFGSYASDLYLPTADMDLVVCSRSYMNGGMPVMVGSKWLHRFRALLTRNNIAQPGTIEPIIHAKVPLVKYIDRESGLRVDISFENLTGVDAIETFMAWKDKYPAMPILVTLIKHFLGMRGLNEPVSGGIGGFSVICLVVSMFQMMPQIQSKSMKAEQHLGEVLMEFFRLYGTSFNYSTVAIRLDPPNYILKVGPPPRPGELQTNVSTVQREAGGVQGQQPKPSLHHRPKQPVQRHCRWLFQLPGNSAGL